MPRRDGTPSKSVSRRLDVRVAIYSPPSTVGDYGEPDVDADSRTLIGYENVSIVPSVASPQQSAGMLKSTTGYAVEMRQRNDISENYQIDVLSGTYEGETLFVLSVGRDGAARSPTMTVLCG